MASFVDAKIRSITESIYDDRKGSAACDRLHALLKDADKKVEQPDDAIPCRFSQDDAVLITYGDTILDDKSCAAKALSWFADQYLRESFSAIHLLPFFPYSSDDGFSVIDFKAVNSSVGEWQDIERIGRNFGLMFDFVLNHISAKSAWFRRYLDQEAGFRDLAIEVSPDTDLSLVTRPRALPLLTPATHASGTEAHVWTTFSADQVDLNYESLDVLTKMVEVLLFYVSKGARMIRMDAVAYLWKQIGTRCIHLPQTHDMVRLFRAVLDVVAPEVLIITETNVPHDENISYFGNGIDEAQMVYNFTLPPLLMYTFGTRDVGVLSRWAKTLEAPSDHTTFFNFTASHDGIGVRPLEGILSSDQIEAVVQSALGNGGSVSYKHNPDGSQSPYELNLTYVDAMDANPEKFLASQAIAMVLPGVPAVYIHSLIGSRNWEEGVEKTGRARTINRRQVHLNSLTTALADSANERSKIFYPYCHMLKIRRSQPAFHPNAGFDVLDLDDQVMAVRRSCEDQTIFALINVGPDVRAFSLAAYGASRQMCDLLTDQVYPADTIRLAPYQTLWLDS